MNPARRVYATALLIIAACQPSSAQAAKPFFLGLGDLPGGDFSSIANGISPNASVVVGASRSAAGQEAFRWTIEDGMSALGDLPGGIHESLAADVSNDGVIVGVGWSENGLEAYSYSPSGGMSGLGFLPGGQLRSDAFAISADSSTIVGAGLNAALNHEAFRYTSLDGMVGLGDLPGGEFESAAISVSHDGSVIVGEARSALGIEAFRWTTGGGMVALGDLPGGGYLSVASDVSADGSIIAGFSSALEFQGSMLNEAFRWTAEEGMSGLGHIPGGVESLAFAVSADGQTIVGSDHLPFSTSPVATIWRQNRGMQSLRDVLIQEHLLAAELAGWRLVTAYDVSGDGTIIVGHGFNPSGIDEAWIARVPEPSTLALAAVTMAAAIIASARRRRTDCTETRD